MLVSLGGHCRPAPASDKPLRDDDNPPSLAGIRPCRLDLAERDPTSDGIETVGVDLRSEDRYLLTQLDVGSAGGRSRSVSVEIPQRPSILRARVSGSRTGHSEHCGERRIAECAEPARTGVRAGSTLWS